jgi:hypothetical protein
MYINQMCIKRSFGNRFHMEGVGGLKSDSKAFGDYFEVGQGKKREKKGREREKIKRERKERERERERGREIFFLLFSDEKSIRSNYF